MKNDTIGCCGKDCPERNATCIATCRRYREQREANMKTYDQRRQAMDDETAIRDVQYSSLRRGRR